MSEETLDATLLSLLACPQDKGPLQLAHTATGDAVLYNPACTAPTRSTTASRCCSSTRPAKSTRTNTTSS